MKFSSMVSTAVTTFTLSLACMLPAQAAGTWETTLLGRDINRNAVAATDVSAVYLYDTTLNVTWLRNANAGAGTSYDNGSSTSDGRMTWDNATAWAANLSTGIGGNTISDWRLPTMTVANPNHNYSYNGSTDFGHNVPGSSSEMASLFFNTLGNKSYVNTSGAGQASYGLTNAASFQNMQSNAYWLGTESPLGPSYAWQFSTFSGQQADSPKYVQVYALAVRTGDVMAPVPEPETYAMLLAGLAVVGAISRRRARAAAALAA